MVNEDTSLYPVDHYEVSESRAALASSIPSYSWSTVSNPYVLSHQTRNYYVHVKAVYNDGTIAYITLSPVENKETNSLSNAILSSIGVLAALSLFYVTYTSFIARRRK
jgi:hypothetical protein